MFLRGSLLAGSVALAALFASQAASAQGVFTLSSPSFKDGERLATKNAGNNKSNPNCVGENVSPALSWSNPQAIANDNLIEADILIRSVRPDTARLLG